MRFVVLAVASVPLVAAMAACGDGEARLESDHSSRCGQAIDYMRLECGILSEGDWDCSYPEAESR
jgi:hypothetical protein